MRFGDGSGISWTICKRSAPRSRQITTPTPHHSVFYGRTLFLTPNQQCQSTKSTVPAQYHFHLCLINFIEYGVGPLSQTKLLCCIEQQEIQLTGSYDFSGSRPQGAIETKGKCTTNITLLRKMFESSAGVLAIYLPILNYTRARPYC